MFDYKSGISGRVTKRTQYYQPLVIPINYANKPTTSYKVVGIFYLYKK